MRRIRRILLAIAILAAGGTQTFAAPGKRVALVMGNSAYVNMSPLEKPVAEARELADLLRKIGVQVMVGTNLNKRDMEKLLQEFRVNVEGAEFGFFHFSGHGFQSGPWSGEPTNHLVPVDFEFPTADGAFETVTLDGIVDLLKQQVRVGVITLDACRNDPRLTVGSIKISRGFSAVRLNDTASGSSTTPPQPGRSWVGRGPSGLVVAYATDPGNVAFEGRQRSLESILDRAGRASADTRAQPCGVTWEDLRPSVE